MLLEKIQELYKKFSIGRADPQDLGSIDGWLTEAKRLLLLKSLKEHAGVQYVCDVFESEIKKINTALLNHDSKVLPERERDRMLDKRDLAQKYLNLFIDIDKQLEKLENDVDKEV